MDGSLILGLTVVIVLLIFGAVMFWLEKKRDNARILKHQSELKFRPVAPPVPPKMVGPDIVAVKDGIVDVIARLEGMRANLLAKRATVWEEAQAEVDRLTDEIATTQKAWEAYQVTLQMLDRDQPRDTPPVPAVIAFPDVDGEELSDALTVDGAIFDDSEKGD